MTLQLLDDTHTIEWQHLLHSVSNICGLYNVLNYNRGSSVEIVLSMEAILAGAVVIRRKGIVPSSVSKLLQILVKDISRNDTVHDKLTELKKFRFVGKDARSEFLKRRIH